MTARLSLKGLNGFNRRLSMVAQLDGFDAALKNSAQAVAAVAAENLSHVTSSSTSGRLQSSLKVTAGDNLFSWRIGTELKYGAYVEFGSVRSPARPWLSPALRAEKQTIVKSIATLLRQSFAQNSGARLPTPPARK